MSISRKALKILSIIYCIGGVLSIGLGAWGIAAGAAVNGSAIDANVFGSVMIAYGIVDLLVGGAGIHAANNPAKSKGAFAWGVICLVCGVVSIALTLPALGGVGVGAQSVISLVVDFVFFALALAVRREGQDRLA